MSLKKICLLVMALFAWTLASCGTSYPTEVVLPTQPVLIEVTTQVPTRTPTVVLPVPTSAPTRALPTATVTSTLEPRPTAVEVDLKQATLRLEELPAGFEILDEKSQAQAGLSADTVGQLFAGIFRQAQPVHSFSYVTSDPKKFEIVVGLVLSPVVAADQAAFDQMLADPNGVMKNFAKNFGSEAKLIPNLTQAWELPDRLGI